MRRESEIARMNPVRSRLVDYEVALDPLWLNGKGGVPASGGGAFVPLP